MATKKKRGELPEALSKEEMIEKIIQTLNGADYSTVYLTYVFLDCMEEDER